MLLRHVLVIALLGALIACDVSAPRPAAEGSDAAAPPPRPAATTPRGELPSFADMVEEARPGVVNIFTRTRVPTHRLVVSPTRQLIPEQRISESLGSGFIIDEDGYVLTNHHVIANATDIEVRLLDDRRFRATLVSDDPKTDVALLKLEGPLDDLPVLPLGDSSRLRVGDWVVAIGNPLGLTSTVTAGIVSATGRRSLPLGGLRYQDFIQTDASINPGNSGGALLNVHGEVVGVSTAMNEAGQGIGFAIPVNMIQEILPRLREGGRIERSWLGIYVDPVPAALRGELELPREGGALVKRVVQGGPADRARLRPGDVILALDDTPIEDDDQLAWLASNIGVGKTVTLRVARGSEQLDVPLVLGALPD